MSERNYVVGKAVPDLVLGTMVQPCERCGVPTAIGPEGQKILADGYGLLCFPCMATSQPGEVVIPEGVRREVERHLGRKVTPSEMVALVAELRRQHRRRPTQ